MRSMVLVVMVGLALAGTATAQSELEWRLLETTVELELQSLDRSYPNAPGRRELGTARDRIAAKDLAGTRAQIEAAIRKGPGMPRYRAILVQLVLIECDVKGVMICLDAADRFRELRATKLDPAVPAPYAEDVAGSAESRDRELLFQLSTKLTLHGQLSAQAADSEKAASAIVEFDPRSYTGYLSRGIARNNLGRYGEAIADIEQARTLAENDADRSRADEFLTQARENQQIEYQNQRDSDRKGFDFHPGPIGVLATYSVVTRPSVLRQMEADVEARGGSMESPLGFGGAVGWHLDRRGVELGFSYMRVGGRAPLNMSEDEFQLRSWGFYVLGEYYLAELGPLSIQLPVSITTSYQKSDFRGVDTNGVAFLIAGGLRVSLTAWLVTVFAEGTYGVDPFVYLSGGGLSNGGMRVMLENGEELDGGMTGPGLRLGVLLGGY